MVVGKNKMELKKEVSFLGVYLFNLD